MTLLAPGSRPSILPFAAVHRERPALFAGDEVLTYHDLGRRVTELSELLGTRERRLVAVEVSNTIDAVVAYLAALAGGHCALLLPPQQGGLLERYDPDVVLSAGSRWQPDERRAGSRHELHPDLALLLSTSGSTGSPKLVRLSRENLESNAAAIGTYLGLSSADRAPTTLPLHYCYGLSVLNSYLAAGASLVLTDLSVVDRCFWDLFREHEATSLAGVPYTFELLERAGFASIDLPSLRYVTQAGGRLRPELVRKYALLGERRGWDFFVMYGQTEATARMAYLPPQLAASRPEAIGVPIPGGDFTIDALDRNGDRAGDDHGAVGELVYHGPNVMLGYASGPADLARGRTVTELRTGDLARLGPDGLYEVVGRRSRFVKPFGVRVDLDDLERVLAELGLAALCTGDDDGLVVGVVAGHSDNTVTETARLVARTVGLPVSRVTTVALPALPRLSSGKPDHAALREVALATSAVPTTAAAGAHTEEVLALFTKVLGHTPSGCDSFVTAGGDSLSYVELSVGLEAVLGSLPHDWHTTPIAELRAAPRGNRLLRRVETSVILRAVAIVLIVGTHTKLWHLPGGAHALVGLAGLNFARFQLASGGVLRSLARIAVPSVLWIGAVAAVSDQFEWPHALLVNGLFGEPDARWAYWFIEAVMYIVGAAGVLLAVPAVRRLERRSPFRFALGIAAAGLVMRFDLIGLSTTDQRIYRPQELVWLFGLGWAAALASTTRQRLVVSALVVAGVAGFLYSAQREAFVIAGILLVLWVPTIPFPARLVRVTGAVASASLYIYLTHWQVYPPLKRAFDPLVGLLGALVVGVVVAVAASSVPRLVARGRAARIAPGKSVVGSATGG